MKNEQGKIGIVTLLDYNNYGNRLQNYALKYTIESLGYDVDTTIINNKSYRYSREKFAVLLSKVIKDTPQKNIKKIKTKIRGFKKKELNVQITNIVENTVRKEKFTNFSNKYLQEKKYELTSHKDLDILSNYDFFVAGSDQVWNPNFNPDIGRYFLSFTPYDKRVSYSASFGISKIPLHFEKYYSKWLNEMKYISVREHAGAEIVKNLTRKEVPVLVDPTMLLKKNEWLEISSRAKNRSDKKYLLTYFLGGPSEDMRKKINRLAKEKKMEVINLGDSNETITYETGPSEFLDYINHASAFFTDSFHGVVFSIIFQTPFVVSERVSSGSSMYSRIETILDSFSLRNREEKGFTQDPLSMDFSGTSEVLEKEYKKSIDYLKKALRIEE